MLSDNQNSDIRSFFGLYRDKVYDLELPEARGRRCWGSPHGWLVTTGSDLKIQLLNPLTRACINLPPQLMFNIRFNIHREWYQFIHKAIIIKESNEEFLVMAIYGPYKDLAFSRPGYSSWVNVEDSSNYRFIDVVFFKGQIFALCDGGSLVVVDINAPGPLKVVCIASPPNQYAWEQLYLVESSGNLLVVYRYERHEPINVEVYKFDLNALEWMKLDDLGNLALFVGDNYSMSISSSSISNCKFNCIYFIGDSVEQWWAYDESCIGRNTGVYSMVDGTVEPFFFGADYPSYYSCPNWVTPALI
ncbi:F-box protein [Actinidia chinensis var. chinensis]|uniref:F-box protein n=1 Tax=Actinidia chinensis var. chinensis TaxID=1590841 RepID=A0A2R6QVG3_ACTCC|nr:F-box protein [Actinidia chinensis var. chinensis]